MALLNCLLLTDTLWPLRYLSEFLYAWLMSTLSRADGSQMAEERIMEEQQKGRSSKKTKKKKKGAVACLIPYSDTVSELARLLSMGLQVCTSHLALWTVFKLENWSISHLWPTSGWRAPGELKWLHACVCCAPLTSQAQAVCQWWTLLRSTQQESIWSCASTVG